MALHSVQFNPHDPENMFAEERRNELASIFARDNLDGQIVEKPSPTCLELSAVSRPDRSTGSQPVKKVMGGHECRTNGERTAANDVMELRWKDAAVFGEHDGLRPFNGCI
jgi:hypothetical protein